MPAFVQYVIYLIVAIALGMLSLWLLLLDT